MNFNGAPVLVVGDVMLDHYISGNAARISPEAPVPIVEKKASWQVPGGAANVARGLARLGCEPALAGLVGNDGVGEAVAAQIAAEGIKNGLVVSRFRPTTCKTRILCQGQQLLRVDEECRQRPEIEEEISLRKTAESLLPGIKAVILSDYAKGVLLPDERGQNLCEYIIHKACQKIPVLVDPKGLDWSRYSGAACVTPNTGEFIKVCAALGLWQGGGEPGSQARTALASELCRRFNIERLLLTRGARGMTLYEPGQPPRNIRAVMREVADVSGAGDTVIATLAACIANGMSFSKAASVANAAAGVAVSKVGTAPVNISELNAALGNAGSKLLNWRELVEKIRLWREGGQRVIFTNGCFDLLHPGHISLLSQCAAMGGRVVVGLNTDASVKRLKGAGRPIQDELSRATLLSALETVDAVVLFNEDTPEELIRVVKPDILVKGSDYSIDQVAGAGFVQSYGGQVRLAELMQGFSTTGLAGRIKGE